MTTVCRKLVFALLLGVLVTATSSQPASAVEQDTDVEEMRKIANEIAVKIAEMPQFTVFDWISFDIDDYVVTLKGTVIDTTTRTMAENAAEDVEGVEGVHNEIDYVQRTKTDDRLRMTLFNAIYQTYLHDYVQYAPYQYIAGSTGTFPRGPHPIQILVNRGNVILRGHVYSAADKATATRAVKNVGGLVRTFENELVVVSKPKE